MPSKTEIQDNSDQIMQGIRTGMMKAMRDVADRIVELGIMYAPVGEGTGAGNLQRSISVSKFSVSQTGVEIEYGAHTEYAAAQEFGSAARGEPFVPYTGQGQDWPTVPPGKQTWKPYKITPNERDYLRFEIDGEVIFTKEVIHPGVKPQPYMRPAIDKVRFEEGEKLIKKRFKEQLAPFKKQNGGGGESP